MTVTCHSKTSDSSTSPAEKPSTGERIKSVERVTPSTRREVSIGERTSQLLSQEKGSSALGIRGSHDRCVGVCRASERSRRLATLISDLIKPFNALHSPILLKLLVRSGWVTSSSPKRLTMYMIVFWETSKNFWESWSDDFWSRCN